MANKKIKIAATDFDHLVKTIEQIHQQALGFASKAVNVGLTLRNWLIGRQIVEYEQQGSDRAAYGEGLLDKLSVRLSGLGLPRSEPRELRRYRQLYLIYPQIWESLTPKSLEDTSIAGFCALLTDQASSKRESPTPKSCSHTPDVFQRLSFTHLAELIQIDDGTHRLFYEIECIRGNWSVRELKRQIASLYYERSGLSKDKEKLSEIAHSAAEPFLPAQIIRDPYIFEFLGLRPQDTMGESDLEDALGPLARVPSRTRARFLLRG